MDLEIVYFNKKNFVMEPMIEPYKMRFTSSMETPLSTYETCIASDDMLEINLTFGCIASL